MGKGKIEVTVESRMLIDRLLAEFSAEDRYEAGGILGGKDGVITVYAVDKNQKSQHPCTYIPDVAMLNQIIGQWYQEGLVLMGVFHTHHFGIRTLSDGDKAYIQKIMSTAAQEIHNMYFPIVVMPAKEVVVYTATRTGDRIKIVEEAIVFKEDQK